MSRLKKDNNALRGKTLKRKSKLALRKQHKNFRNLAIAFAIVTVGAVIYISTLQNYTLEAKQRVQLESTQSQLIETEQRLLDTEALNKEQYDAQQKQLKDVQDKLKETEEALQAKRSAQKAYALKQKATPKKAPTASFVATGNKETWLAASGIPQSQWWAVDAIVTRESGWNPNAVNPNGGACGLGQQLPCGKWAGAWNDPVAALKAMNIYVNGSRFDSYGGGWPGAVAFWNVNHWY